MCRRICVPGLGPYPPRLPPAARTPANQRSASGVGASTSCREVSTWGVTVLFPVRRICGDGRVLIQRWALIPPGCGDWLYGPQPISDQPVGLGFPHRERRYCPRRSPLSCRVCWVRGCMEVLMIRRLDPILPGCRWLSEPPPTISGGIEVSLPCEAASAQEITMFVHSWLKRWMRRRICVPGMGPYPPRLPPVPRTPANQRSASGIGASAPCRQVSTLRITVSSSGRRICGDGSVSDPEMGS